MADDTHIDIGIAVTGADAAAAEIGKVRAAAAAAEQADKPGPQRDEVQAASAKAAEAERQHAGAMETSAEAAKAETERLDALTKKKEAAAKASQYPHGRKFITTHESADDALRDGAERTWVKPAAAEEDEKSRTAAQEARDKTRKDFRETPPKPEEPKPPKKVPGEAPGMAPDLGNLGKIISALGGGEMAGIASKIASMTAALGPYAAILAATGQVVSVVGEKFRSVIADLKTAYPELKKDAGLAMVENVVSWVEHPLDKLKEKVVSELTEIKHGLGSAFDEFVLGGTIARIKEDAAWAKNHREFVARLDSRIEAEKAYYAKRAELAERSLHRMMDLEDEYNRKRRAADQKIDDMRARDDPSQAGDAGRMVRKTSRADSDLQDQLAAAHRNLADAEAAAAKVQQESDKALKDADGAARQTFEKMVAIKAQISAIGEPVGEEEKAKLKALQSDLKTTGAALNSAQASAAEAAASANDAVNTSRAKVDEATLNLKAFGEATKIEAGHTVEDLTKEWSEKAGEEFRRIGEAAGEIVQKEGIKADSNIRGAFIDFQKAMADGSIGPEDITLIRDAINRIRNNSAATAEMKSLADEVSKQTDSYVAAFRELGQTFLQINLSSEARIAAELAAIKKQAAAMAARLR